MKKALLLVNILFISVISTACINNFAVQQLNNKAKDYMDKGEYQEAIARLKSSLDLDSTMFETHYNIAVAYTKADDYYSAMEAYEAALKLKPNFADTYYSLAVCEENLAKDIISGKVEVDETGAIIRINPDELPTDQVQNRDLIAKYLNGAIDNYETYIKKVANTTAKKAADTTDKEDIENKIQELNELVAQYDVPVAR